MPSPAGPIFPEIIYYTSNSDTLEFEPQVIICTGICNFKPKPHLKKQDSCFILKSRFDVVVVQNVHERLLGLSDIKHAKVLLIDVADVNDYPSQIGYFQGTCLGQSQPNAPRDGCR